jgi:mycothione reductase
VAAEITGGAHDQVGGDGEHQAPGAPALAPGEPRGDLEPDGRLRVDTYQRALAGGRPVSGVFGLGDLTSSFQLKHVAL